VLLFRLENKHRKVIWRRNENKSLEESILSVCATDESEKTNEIPRHRRETMWKRRKHLICLVILYLWLIESVEVEGKVDICSSLCRCVNESLFVKIHCDFFDSKVSHCEILTLIANCLCSPAAQLIAKQAATAHTHFILTHILNCFVYLLTFSITLICN
jgi:hypothetical protein